MFLIDQIKEQKILDMEVDLDKFISENSISEKSMIFKMVFSKDVFKEEKEVREYLKDKYVYEPLIEESESEFTASLVSLTQMDLDTEVKIDLRRGVVAYAADMLPAMSFDEVQFNDKGEINLSSKFGTINLSEGLPHIIEIARVAEGEHPAYGRLKITKEHLKSMELNFNNRVQGVDCAINEDHKKNEAFGWLKEVFLSFDEDVLYGVVNWNRKGITALSEREYRYFSPEFRFNYVHPHSGQEYGPTLLGGALTNYPFLKMEAIVELNNKQTGEEKVTTETISLSEHQKTVIELNAKNQEIQGKLDASEARNVELNDKNVELNAKVETLETEKKETARKAANEKLFADNKINKAQLVALNEGKGMLEVLALGENMNTSPDGGNKNDDEEIQLSEEEKKLAKKLGLTDEEFINGNKEL